MNHPSFKELFEAGAERLLMSPQQADEALNQMQRSEGWQVLCLGVSVRKQVLINSLATINAFENPGNIAHVQAEIKALDCIMDDMADMVDEYFVDFINQKKEKEKKPKEDEHDYERDYIPSNL